MTFSQPLAGILTTIFSTLADERKLNNNEKLASSLRHVSAINRYWRKVFITNPLMWTTVDQELLNSSPICIEHSRETPIDVSYVVARRDVNSVGIFQAIQLALSQLHRIRTLKISAPSKFIKQFSFKLHQQPAPILGALSIAIDYLDPSTMRDCGAAPPEEDIPLLPIAPRLIAFFMESVAARPTLELLATDRLRVLHLNCKTCLNPITLPYCLRLLSSLPLLTELAIETALVRGFTDTPLPSVICLPRLGT
jgi:hypothetical protein